MVHAHHRTHFVYTVAAGVDHNVAVDITFVRMDRPSVVLALRKACDRCVSIDFSTCFACMESQRLTQLRGINISIFSIPEPANKVVSGNQGMSPCALFGVNDLVCHSHPARH